MLTKTELAKQAGIPASSLTYYIEQFGEYFDPQFIAGRRYPTYKEDSVRLAQLIRDLVGERKNPNEIRKELEDSGYSPIVDFVETTNLVKRNINDSDSLDNFDNSPSLEASLRAMEVLNRMNDNLRIVIEKQESEIEDFQSAIEEQKTKIAELQKTIEELQTNPTRKKK